jgi:hypothetical protein
VGHYHLRIPRRLSLRQHSSHKSCSSAIPRFRIGVLMTYAADDPVGQARLLAFAQELARSGWTDGRNVRIAVRYKMMLSVK